jgi:hypothetical protein
MHELANPTGVTISQLSQALIKVRGRTLDFGDYKPMRHIYDIEPGTLTIRAGRQVGKSVSLGSIIIANSIRRGHFNTLFLAPLAQQTSRFSSMYLDDFLSSPVIKRHFRDADSKKNVHEKSLSNQSKIYLSYAEIEADADRVRGIAADALYWDEIQEVSHDALPVVEETLSASLYGFKRYTGTSKTLNNTLEYKFRDSTQCHWVIKCPHCNHYNIPNTFEVCMKMCNSDQGLSCERCTKLIDNKTGEWIAGRPDVKNNIGFSVPQFIIPFRTNIKKWAELREKILRYPVGKISNEIFGLPIGLGGRILSESEAMNCCDPNRKEWDKGWPRDDRAIISVVIGVDWSVTASEESFTVITVLGYDYTGKCFIMHSERVNSIDILQQVARIEQLYHQFGAQAIGSDRGVGVVQCQILQQHLGHDKVFPINYVNAKIPLRFDSAGQYYAADRTMMMDTVFLKMKIGKSKFECPAWSLTASPFWEDALAIFEEETLAGKRVFRHDEDKPDDSFHSVVFGNIAHMILAGDFVYADDPQSKMNEYI